jgi:ABC-type uncharacterized transport system auxiliary subunit
MKQYFLAFLAMIVLSGCGFKEIEKTPQNFRLQNIFEQPVASSTDLRVILIQNVRGDSVALSKAIIYNQKGALKAYKYSRWSELPSQRIQQLIIQSFNDRKLFRAAVPALSLAKSELSLESELEQFEQVYKDGNSFVQIQMNFRLIQKKDAKVLGIKSLHVEVPIKQKNTLATVNAFNQAISKLVLELGDWVRQSV